ncbi:MAG: HlyD family efflux transporter periplasmic adaptor subunit [Oscillospiraceae bacterium]|nr:HlyD family efflux transporter periplasmic adaptor subunit [Oscillospiraceae bacterium]
MRKILGFLVCLVLLAAMTAVPAAAETDLTAYSISNGTVQASAFDDLTAPCSGTLLPFDWSIGDTVEAGTVLFQMMTTRITAPENGIVSCLFVEEGDSADAAMSTYGAVATLEPEHLLRMHGNYNGAHQEQDCLHIHVGQPLFFKLGHEKGSGVVISNSDRDYEVEIFTGEYNIDKILTLYKDEDYDYHGRVGEGKVYRRDDVTIGASCVVTELLVKRGDSVKKGDTLLLLLPPDADLGAVPDVTAPSAGVISTVGAASGQQVWKGQLLARISRTDSLEIVADVDEMDLNGLKVGDRVPVTLDTNESEILTGTVTEISGLGVTRQNAAYFTVHLTVDKSDLMLGQSASVYLPRN